MIKSLVFHPEKLGTQALPSGRLPPHASHRLTHAVKAGWQHERFWLAEQYYKGKHAYASFVELYCPTEIHLPAACVRQDLIWLYLLKGEHTVEPLNQAAISGEASLSLRQGQYAPAFMGMGEYSFAFAPGHHRLLFLAAQFKWMKRYEVSGFAAFRFLLQPPSHGFLSVDPLVIHTRHLRHLAQLRQMAHAASFRQDVALYAELDELFACYLADVAGLAKADTRVRETKAEKVAEIAAYLDKAVSLGNTPSPLDLATLFNLHKKTLYRYFSEVLGTTPAAYAHRIRMEQAYRLLSNEHLRPLKVAYQLGYNHLRTFEREYKNHYKTTPLETYLKGQKK